DQCFYIGMGGREAFPTKSYESYQCCPSKPAGGTKVAKLASSKSSKQVAPARPESRVQTKTVVKKSPKVVTPPPKTNPAKLKDTKEKPGKAIPAEKEGRAKPKKGLFGTGKYIWWW
ncbi:hypothetical protein HHI36_013310, partial [Cryptolaemus montrouzieri]